MISFDTFVLLILSFVQIIWCVANILPVPLLFSELLIKVKPLISLLPYMNVLESSFPWSQFSSMQTVSILLTAGILYTGITTDTSAGAGANSWLQ